MLHDNRLWSVEEHGPDHRLPLLFWYCSLFLLALGCQSHQRGVPARQGEKYHFRHDGRSSTIRLWYRYGSRRCLYRNHWLAVGLPCRRHHQFLHVHPGCMAIAPDSCCPQTTNLVSPGYWHRLAGSHTCQWLPCYALLRYLVSHGLQVYSWATKTDTYSEHWLATWLSWGSPLTLFYWSCLSFSSWLSYCGSAVKSASDVQLWSQTRSGSTKASHVSASTSSASGQPSTLSSNTPTSSSRMFRETVLSVLLFASCQLQSRAPSLMWVLVCLFTAFVVIGSLCSRVLSRRSLRCWWLSLTRAGHTGAALLSLSSSTLSALMACSLSPISSSLQCSHPASKVSLAVCSTPSRRPERVLVWLWHCWLLNKLPPTRRIPTRHLLRPWWSATELRSGSVLLWLLLPLLSAFGVLEESERLVLRRIECALPDILSLLKSLLYSHISSIYKSLLSGFITCPKKGDKPIVWPSSPSTSQRHAAWHCYTSKCKVEFTSAAMSTESDASPSSHWTIIWCRITSCILMYENTHWWASEEEREQLISCAERWQIVCIKMQDGVQISRFV